MKFLNISLYVLSLILKNIVSISHDKRNNIQISLLQAKHNALSYR